MTKRLIIEGDWILRESPRGKYWCIDLDAERVHIAWPDDPGVIVEDVPDPLPTEPGTRFWGKSNKLPQEQPWFVQGVPGWRVRSDRAGIVYVPALGGQAYNADCCLNGSLAEREGLVRLPDPEATR